MARTTPRYRAALVDLDDTLFDHQAHRREALTELRGLGVWIGVVTNGLWAEQTHKLRVLGLDGAVDELITSERVGHRKPARKFFDHAVSRARAAPADCIVIGDLWEIDIQGALDMGMVTSLLPTEALLRGMVKV